MDIKIVRNNAMTAVLTNFKDDLRGQISAIKTSNDSNLIAFKADIDDMDYHTYFVAYITKDEQDNLHVTTIEPVKSDLYQLSYHALQHGFNMIKGFFSSNAYRRYAIKHNKNAKLIAKKRRLKREIHNIDMKVYGNNEAHL